MALPLTVKTETVLANQSRLRPSEIYDSGTTDRMSEADLPIQIGPLEERKEAGTMTTTKGRETQDDSRCIMKTTTLPITDAVSVYLTRIWIEDLLLTEAFRMMSVMSGIGTLIITVPGRAAGPLIAQTEGSPIIMEHVEGTMKGTPNLVLEEIDSRAVMVTQKHVVGE